MERFHQGIEFQATLDALDRMRAAGCDLTQPISIDFHVAAPSETAASSIASAAQSRGFRVAVVAEDEGDWTVWCACTLIPAPGDIASVESVLEEIAKPFGGRSDGWGAEY